LALFGFHSEHVCFASEKGFGKLGGLTTISVLQPKYCFYKFPEVYFYYSILKP
jgi:hypothetical protein